MLPILPGDIKVDLGPGRHPDLPEIFQTTTHPLWKSEGNIYYYIQDLSEAGMRRSADLERRLRIPQGPETKALDEGRCHGFKVWNKLLIVFQDFSNYRRGMWFLYEAPKLLVREKRMR
jgi:hypothetical protein